MTGDKIRLVNMSFYGYHGVHRDERRMGRKFYIDVELTLDLRPAGGSDDLSRTIDYAAVYALIRAIEGSKQYSLLEALAEDIAQRILERFPARQVVVRTRKSEVPVGGLMDYAEVEITRTRRRGRAEARPRAAREAVGRSTIAPPGREPRAAQAAPRASARKR
jgi:dihydroneopterin aldolase